MSVRILTKGKFQHKGGSCLAGFFHPDSAAILMDNSIDGAQAQARPFSQVFGRKKWVKYPGKIFLGYAATGIGDFYIGEAGGAFFASPSFLALIAVSPQGQGAFSLHGINRVDDQVDNHLVELAPVHFNQHFLVCQLFNDLYIDEQALVPNEAQALFDQVIEVYSLLVGARLAAISEKALDNVSALIGVFDNRLQYPGIWDRL